MLLPHKSGFDHKKRKGEKDKEERGRDEGRNRGRKTNEKAQIKGRLKKKIIATTDFLHFSCSKFATIYLLGKEREKTLISRAEPKAKPRVIIKTKYGKEVKGWICPG